MKNVDVETFEKLSSQIIGVYDELSLLSKKSPNDAVNKFKLKYINTIINESNELLKEKYKPFEDFNEFNEDDVPQNSDIVFIISQYIQCFDKFKADNVINEGAHWYWVVENEDGKSGAGMNSRIKTTQPRIKRW